MQARTPGVLGLLLREFLNRKSNISDQILFLNNVFCPLVKGPKEIEMSDSSKKNLLKISAEKLAEISQIL